MTLPAAYELAAQRGDCAELLALARQAIAAAEQSGDAGALEEALTLQTIALLRGEAAAEALASAERALQLRRQDAGGEQQPFVCACTLAAVAKAFNGVGKGNDALAHMIEALTAAEPLSEEERSLFDRLFAE